MDSHTIQLGAPNQSLDEIVDFLARIFGPNYYDAKRIQAATIQSEPSTGPQNFVIARSNQGDIIGVVRIVERQMLLGQSILNCGGISSVSVHPACRKQGLNNSMMDKAIKEMTIRGMDLTYLHSRRAMDGHYTKFGYYGINRYNSLEILSLISNSNENALRFSAFKECNLDRIRKYYDQSYSSLSGSIVRDEKIWQFLISRINASPEHFNLLECNLCESDELIGYVLVSGDKLIELSLPAAYFNHLPLALRTARIKFISIHPFHPYYRFVRTSYSTILHERISLDGGYMGKILSPFFLISKLSMGICQKAREIGVDGENVRIAGYEIDLRSGQILEATQPDDVTFEKQGHLIRFILGMHQCSQYDGIKINKDKPWIEYLFPSSGFHTSAFDEI